MDNIDTTLRRKKLGKDDSFYKLKGISEAGKKVRIKWDPSVSEEYDEGYLFATPSCKPDEGDLFVHINKPFDNSEEWKHLYELLDNVCIIEIEVLN